MYSKTPQESTLGRIGIFPSFRSLEAELLLRLLRIPNVSSKPGEKILTSSTGFIIIDRAIDFATSSTKLDSQRKAKYEVTNGITLSDSSLDTDFKEDKTNEAIFLFDVSSSLVAQVNRDEHVRKHSIRRDSSLLC
mmetsp:Transcript_15525/g.17464  ORF Transcript_15525/g.17464 Transcript_15525/m.17464 type:complete len:135 (+) Transcript_15525:1350-1754(+)